ncbi:non-structural maintenance of chromosomes element 3 homolog [Agrilus planipennis]|uniref:Non-structural maintenance of chromosomes element 3 homolog n=1 Tax=Agrilus planipennis TaxID=224129 RepID=A0A7F5R7A7_AGRPL|nr:non-structural maintenance of chromosomes element 3 homolog [Agrilus planipennis]
MGKRSQISHKQKAKPHSSQNVSQNLTQRTLEASFANSQNEPAESFEETVNKVVRYVIYNAGSNLPIRKIDLLKHVLPGIGKRYENIMTEATNVLNEVYGFDLHVCDQSVSNKQYIVINILPYMRTTNEDKHTPKDGKQIIILLVLTHVFMSNDNAPEETIFRFLQSFELDLSIKHELFGNIKDFIRNDMVKQRYLSVSVDEHTRKISYSWGTRAETDVSKAKILQFVCNAFTCN